MSRKILADKLASMIADHQEAKYGDAICVYEVLEILRDLNLLVGVEFLNDLLKQSHGQS